MHELKRRACRTVEHTEQTYEEVIQELKGIHSIFVKLLNNIWEVGYTELPTVNTETNFDFYISEQLEDIIKKLELFA